MKRAAVVTVFAFATTAFGATASAAVPLSSIPAIPEPAAPGAGVVPAGASTAPPVPNVVDDMANAPKAVAPKVPAVAPSPRIRSNEKVDGILVTRSPAAPVGPATHVVVEGEPDRPACVVLADQARGIAQDRVFAYPKGAPMRVRDEHIVVDGERARLELRTMIVDPRTLGARVVDHATIALAVVARGPGAVRVYAYREGETVHVVAPQEPGRATFRDQRASLATTSCPHVHMIVTADGGGLAILATPPAGKDAKTVVAAIGAKDPSGAPAPAPAPTNGGRLLRVAASVSQSHRDPEPLVSVSIGVEPGTRVASSGDPLSEDLSAVSLAGGE